MNIPKALVLRAPGINCDRETAQACRQVGFDTDLLHINHLLKTPELLLDYQLLVIPGGFSYGDDLGAGTLLAKNLTIHLGQQLHQFINEGRLVLGICNGFQVLVRAGLLPGHLPNAKSEQSNVAVGGDLSSPPPMYRPDSHTPIAWGGTNTGTNPSHISIVPSVPNVPTASLTDNASAQFECRWVTLSIQPSTCIFTQRMEHPIELPVAHGEGQFVLANPPLLSQLQASGQIPLLYTINTKGVRSTSPSSAAPSSLPPIPYPDNPNGSIGNIAGVCNARGNVFGLMPHPERYIHVLQHPQRRSSPCMQGQGDGLLIFNNAYEYARKSITPSVGASAKRSEARFNASPSPMYRPLVTSTTSFHQFVKPHHSAHTYASSGVNIAAAASVKELMKDAVRATQGPEVLAGMGAFAGVFNAISLQQMRRPALVASTDGVGTKTLIAAQAGRFDTIGYDLVNHSANDLLTQQAKPLFFMDYLAMGKLDPMQAAMIVCSVASACQEVACALLGGETAEMPDVYLPEAFDLAGTIVGVVDQESIVNPNPICPSDVLLGLPSSGLHTNGYSLARRVFASYPLDTIFPELGEPLVDVLLRPHRCYLPEIQTLQEHSIAIKAMAHITGGGFAGNVSRILPTGTQAIIETNSWSVPPLFQLLGHLGQVTHEEMYRTFNMGVGMVLVLSPEAAAHAHLILPELLNVGYITKGNGVVLK